MKIGIIGAGTVGGTLRNWLIKNTDHILFTFDPDKGFNDSMDECDCVFISVPVPTKEDGSQDYTFVHQSIRRCPDIPIFIRSTVLPGTCDGLSAEYKKKVYAAPEFLTARYAEDDFIKLPFVTSGCKELLQGVFCGNKEILLTGSNVKCELGKYAHNCLGALKVHFCNLIQAECESFMVSYEDVRDVMCHTGHINKVHTDVPGPDGLYGFGGTCFPKDFRALARWIGWESLKMIDEENLNIRKYQDVNNA